MQFIQRAFLVARHSTTATTTTGSNVRGKQSHRGWIQPLHSTSTVLDKEFVVLDSGTLFVRCCDASISLRIRREHLMHFQYGNFIVFIFFCSFSFSHFFPFGISAMLISLSLFLSPSFSCYCSSSSALCHFVVSSSIFFAFFSRGYLHAAQRNGDIIINMVLSVMRCDAIELAASVRLEFSNSNNIGCLQRLRIILFYFAASFALSLPLPLAP